MSYCLHGLYLIWDKTVDHISNMHCTCLQWLSIATERDQIFTPNSPKSCFTLENHVVRVTACICGIDLTLIRNSGLNIIKTFFRVEENIELKLTRRGCRPLGGGQVTFRCRVANQTFRPLQITDQVRNILLASLLWLSLIMFYKGHWAKFQEK